MRFSPSFDQAMSVRASKWIPATYMNGVCIWAAQAKPLTVIDLPGIEFAPGELGEPLDPDMLPTVVAKVSLDMCRSCLF